VEVCVESGVTPAAIVVGFGSGAATGVDRRVVVSEVDGFAAHRVGGPFGNTVPECRSAGVAK